MIFTVFVDRERRLSCDKIETWPKRFFVTYHSLLSPASAKPLALIKKHDLKKDTLIKKKDFSHGNKKKSKQLFIIWISSKHFNWGYFKKQVIRNNKLCFRLEMNR